MASSGLLMTKYHWSIMRKQLSKQNSKNLHKCLRIFKKILNIKQVKHFIVLCVITSIVLPVLCSFLHNSVFYIKSKNLDEAKKYMKLLNQERLNKSLEELNRFHVTSEMSRKIDIGLTFITVDRNQNSDHFKPKYLTQVVGKMLSLLNDDSLSKSYEIFLCNVDNNPEAYEEIKPLMNMFKTFQRFPFKTSITVNVFEKEKQDYLYCLNETMKRNVTYTFLIEDDAYPENDLFSVLEHIIKRRIENKYTEVKAFPRNVTYLKFYHLPAVLGYWSYELERIPELLSLSLFFGTIFCQIYVYFVKKSQLLLHKIWILCVLYVCFVAMGIGRQNLLELRRISKYLYLVTPSPSCCTPAMLFTRGGGQTVLNLMKNVTCVTGYGKDTLLDDIRRENSLVCLMIQPNLFSHIGYYSTLRAKLLNLDSLL